MYMYVTYNIIITLIYTCQYCMNSLRAVLVGYLGYNYYNVSVFLISSYGTPLAQRACCLALHSSLFGPVAQLIMIILSVTALTLS